MSISPRVSPTALIALLLAASPAAHADTLTWPSPASCPETLQLCVQEAASGDVVEIATDEPIDEHITVRRTLTLRGAAGFAPRFAESRRLFVDSLDSSLSVIVEDLDWLDGGISVDNSGGRNIDLVVRRSRIASTARFGAIAAFARGKGSLDLQVENCDIEVAGDAVGPSGIFWVGEGANGNVAVRFNRIHAHSLERNTALIFRNSGGALRVDAVGNRIFGELDSGVFIEEKARSGLTGGTVAYVLSNHITGQDHAFSERAAVYAENIDGALEIHVVNNTLVDNDRGIFLENRPIQGGGTVTGSVSNNIIVDSLTTGIAIDNDIDGGSAVTNGHNLLFRNGSNHFVPGPGTLFDTDPMLRRDGFRLRDNSPAIGTGDTAHLEKLHAARGFPLVDVDGLARIKNGAIDIGAFESGTAHHLHVDDSAASNDDATIIHWSQIDGQADAPVLFTQNASPPESFGVFNPAHMGLFYNGVKWSLFNEGGQDVPLGTAANLFRPAIDGVFGHLSAAANVSGRHSVLDDERINGRSDKVLLVAHHFGGYGSPGNRFNASFSVGYFVSGWFLADNTDSQFPIGRGFAVYAQDASQSAFRHTIRVGDTLPSGSAAIIDHPLLNGRDCAQIQLTRDGLIGSPHPFAAAYNQAVQKWTVIHTDNAPVQPGDAFHVLLDPAQIDDCSSDPLFSDGFE